MKTPTETPRVDTEICRASHSNGSGGEEEWEYVEPDFARQLERELAAVTKERDDLKRAREINKEAIVLLVKERDEAYADRARLREALENAAAFIKPEVHFVLFQKTQAALSTPPPPVVPDPETEKLIQGVEHLHAVCAGFTPQPHPEIDQAWAEFQEALTAYRAKHPATSKV